MSDAFSTSSLTPPSSPPDGEAPLKKRRRANGVRKGARGQGSERDGNSGQQGEQGEQVERDEYGSSDNITSATNTKAGQSGRKRKHGSLASRRPAAPRSGTAATEAAPASGSNDTVHNASPVEPPSSSFWLKTYPSLFHLPLARIALAADHQRAHFIKSDLVRPVYTWLDGRCLVDAVPTQAVWEAVVFELMPLGKGMAGGSGSGGSGEKEVRGAGLEYSLLLGTAVLRANGQRAAILGMAALCHDQDDISAVLGQLHAKYPHIAVGIAESCTGTNQYGTVPASSAATASGTSSPDKPVSRSQLLDLLDAFWRRSDQVGELSRNDLDEMDVHRYSQQQVQKAQQGGRIGYTAVQAENLGWAASQSRELITGIRRLLDTCRPQHTMVAIRVFVLGAQFVPPQARTIMRHWDGQMFSHVFPDATQLAQSGASACKKPINAQTGKCTVCPAPIGGARSATDLCTHVWVAAINRFCGKPLVFDQPVAFYIGKGDTYRRIPVPRSFILSPVDDPQGSRGHAEFRPSDSEWEQRLSLLLSVEAWGWLTGLTKIVAPDAWRLRHQLNVGEDQAKPTTAAMRRLASMNKATYEIKTTRAFPILPHLRASPHSKSVGPSPSSTIYLNDNDGRQPTGNICTWLYQELIQDRKTFPKAKPLKHQATTDDILDLFENAERIPRCVDPDGPGWMARKVAAAHAAFSVARGNTIKTWTYAKEFDGSFISRDDSRHSMDLLLGFLDTHLTREGINTALMYIPSALSMFEAHSEDFHLHSANMMFFGLTRMWYGIPPNQFDTARDVILKLTSAHDPTKCGEALQHKRYWASPEVLRSHGITVHPLPQEAGDLIVTYPCGIHQGVNTGPAVCDAINLLLPRYFDEALRFNRVLKCDCGKKDRHIDEPYKQVVPDLGLPPNLTLPSVDLYMEQKRILAEKEAREMVADLQA